MIPPRLIFKTGSMKILDQRLLPDQVKFITVKDAAGTAKATKDMALRGAPLIGCAAAFGFALELRRLKPRSAGDLEKIAGKTADLLKAARPTAVALFYAADRMEAFADGRPIERGPINIHQVLNHVRRLSQNGFGKGVRFIETYDPSLPDVHGDRDQLIQVFLNLVKNACEVPGDVEREIELSTAYRHGLRLAVPGQQTRVNLPLVVSVRDNGRGVSDEIRSHLFDAFVTNKPTGTGLGLALVAKIINDHGGAIEFDSEPGRTTFRVMLPLQFPQATP